MVEQESRRDVFREVRRIGVCGVLAVSASFAICPGDDIAALVAAVVPTTHEVVAHQGVMPSQDQYRLKLSDPDKRGRKIPRRINPIV